MKKKHFYNIYYVKFSKNFNNLKSMIIQKKNFNSKYITDIKN
jgi:hypothetical protein